MPTDELAYNYMSKLDSAAQEEIERIKLRAERRKTAPEHSLDDIRGSIKAAKLELEGESGDRLKLTTAKRLKLLWQPLMPSCSSTPRTTAIAALYACSSPKSAIKTPRRSRRATNALSNTLKAGRSDMDIVFEVILKMGVPLDFPVLPITVNDKKVYSIGEDAMLLCCLDSGITPEDIEAMCDLAPAKVIAAAEGFADDTALSNAHYILKDRDIKMRLL